ncbi:hypothetical protein SDC9_208541 [bioreactor metagenome]|uniref:Uncharacterized protein n=1 Tax=bioreactor metagenome TaxID=1076179 RepID=A0A645JDQ2_9ZZZZ
MVDGNFATRDVYVNRGGFHHSRFLGIHKPCRFGGERGIGGHKISSAQQGLQIDKCGIAFFFKGRVGLTVVVYHLHLKSGCFTSDILADAAGTNNTEGFAQEV